MLQKLSTDELAKILWDYNNIRQQVTKSDAILVLGSHDIRVAHKGAELFLEGYAPILMFSGKKGQLTKNLWQSKSEAEVFAEEAIKMGVPSEKILIENQSTNTGENIQFSKSLLQKKLKTIHQIILVQKPYMLRRTYATCKKIWPEIEIFVTSPDLTFENYTNEHISKERLFNIMVGDTQRIKLYAEKGFQIPQEMPKKVWEATQELIKRGYSKHLAA